ncbi:glycosyltransferase [Sutcliffiella horikoshii]|uniref:glycosyltransferase n=1 Tax=Sutcliffiella horikoshii TaxID=79883 RepID=UPI00384F8A37
MNKKICMFVWNHFTNDARVLRECTALSENGYKVDLICIEDPNDEGLSNYEERNPNFKVYRVKRYPLLLDLIKKSYSFFKQNLVLGVLVSILWILLFFLSPIITSLITITILALVKTKLQVLWVRGSIILRMIRMGFKLKYDIYHANDLNTLPQAYICSKLRLKKKKLVYDSHEVQTSRTGYESAFHGKLEKFLVYKADVMIVENHTRAKYNENLYGFYPEVLHNYPFMSNHSELGDFDLHKKLGISKYEKILLYQGGIQTGRGLENLIKAFPSFKEGTLVLIGDGKIKPKLIKMVEENNIQEKVKFIPKVPLKELPKYTKNAYIGFQVLNNVCFNHYSASSNKLFEYIMSGIPLVACDFPEIKKVVETENVGLCIDSHNPMEIAKAVNKLLVNQDMRNKMSGNCNNAKLKYNWENEKHSLINIYAQLLHGGVKDVS